MKQEPRQWKGRTGGGKFGQKSLFFMLRFINVFLFYPLLFAVVPFYMLFGRKGYKAIMWYFKQCHSFSTWEAFRQTFRNHLVFGQVVLDKFSILAGRKDRYTVEITGKDCFDKLMNKNAGFIVVSSHIGNFEMGGLMFAQNKKQLYALTYDGETAEMHQTRKQVMKEVGIHIISVNEDMSHLFILKQALENGDILTVPCDRLYGSSKKVKCNFLGKDAYFPLGPFLLAGQMNVSMVALFMMKDSWKKYHAYIFPVEVNSAEVGLDKKAELLASKFVGNCEEIIRKYPQQWFNFYDFWKV
ncbi:MAG: lipid A biosynthesis (KDO)2-(lauroyl)-lipid IVA acyltransferase [Bacteroidales bacterium]|jgi:predicted LPLAT superfamily acyltransferase|nr:lipid A biosynthesis (KDO)2-(lauroyl)-lipid IVA acyltransferase [Bacteroidales bacterium]